MQFIRRVVLTVPVLGAALFSAASATPSTLPSVAADTTTITVRTTSAALAFNPDLITVKAGSTVKIRYINESVFSHNMVILKSEDDIDPVGAASFDAHDSGFVPMQFKERYIAFSPVAGAGKTVEFTFTAPAAGEYPYVCFVDGHFNMMIGTLKVVQ
jgi:plastocyanin